MEEKRIGRGYEIRKTLSSLISGEFFDKVLIFRSLGEGHTTKPITLYHGISERIKMPGREGWEAKEGAQNQNSIERAQNYKLLRKQGN